MTPKELTMPSAIEDLNHLEAAVRELTAITNDDGMAELVFDARRSLELLMNRIHAELLEDELGYPDDSDELNERALENRYMEDDRDRIDEMNDVGLREMRDAREELEAGAARFTPGLPVYVPAERN